MKIKTKDCLVCFSSEGRENYNKGMLRLIDSAVEHWKGDFLFYSPDHWLTQYKGITIYKGLPDPEDMESFPHSEMPYQFKYSLIQKACEIGYQRIVWLDTSMILNKDITPLFDSPTNEKGISVFHNLGHPLWKYISDDALNKLELTRENVGFIEQIWGGALMFDFTKKNCIDLFEQIKEFSINGSFKDSGSDCEGFVAHRHDQAVLSVLLNGKCNMFPYGTIASEEHAKTKEYGDDVYIIYK